MGGYKTLLAFALGGSLLLSACAQERATPDEASAAIESVDVPKVNPELVEFHKQYEAGLVQVSPRIHAAYAFDYSNYGYIEGDDGIILVDAGWFPDQGRRSMAELRKITDKPIVAIIYTHLHLDHYGGASGIMENEDFDGPIYGPEGWEKWVRESFTQLRPEMFRRIYSQMGLLLPDGEDGTVGSGVGVKPAVGGIPVFSHKPNVSVGKPTVVNISGVEIHMIPTPGDLNEHLFIWVPEEDVLFVGDVLAGTFPAIETVRFEADRDPLRQIAAYERALKLDPNAIIGGHGRLLIGRDDARDVMQANRDVTEFMIDQLDRLYLKGYSADDVIDSLRLPEKLAEHPDLQLHYHRLEWMIKTMHMKRAGFVGSSMDYVTLTESEEAKRLVPLMGGVDGVLEAATEALADDPRWAARLATYVLEVDSENSDARKLRQTAFRIIAGTTLSANERNYMLTAIKEENSEVNWKQLFSAPDLQVIETLDTETILKLMKVRFRAEDANDDAFTVRLNISGDDAPHFFTVRNNTLFLDAEASGEVESTANIERNTLNEIAANVTDWQNAADSDGIDITQGDATFRRFAALIE